ncbi:hypothetical protein DSL64_03500 [Dyadobacter luteus]|uniref:Uncharacterized protein n=2 Tax=Dyadobacter luteus TaxID=2259619 RepID=A0A3D8YFS0_9BACT|nr:hypothetical protein DSL64_03500 [Dyadobacter luteus]
MGSIRNGGKSPSSEGNPLPPSPNRKYLIFILTFLLSAFGYFKANLGMGNQIEIYETSDGKTLIEVKFDQETVCLTQRTMAELFQTTVQNINMRLGNVCSAMEN